MKVKVVNDFTKEPVSFASINWLKANYGGITDSAGELLIKKSNILLDTLVIRYVGFENLYKPSFKLRDTSTIVIFLREAKLTEEVVVKSKFSKGLRWWKNVVTHKPQNNPYRFNNYSYELYNKLEMDLNNMKQSSFNNIKPLKPFGFVLGNIDSTTEAKPFLPIFLTESLSDYYYSNNPHKVRENIKALATNGIKNETVFQFLGGISQKINIYEDYLVLFSKEFISPISSIGDRFYNYKGADTQIINKQKFYHLFFTPKQEGSNTFIGDCWIHSTTWAIQKINITASPSANINFVNRLSVVQEFKQLNDTLWVFAKDKFVADLSPFKKDKISFIGRKTSTYKNVHINETYIDEELIKNKKQEEAFVSDDAKEKDKLYWQKNRQEELSDNEKKIYQIIDTLNKSPLFIKYKNIAQFALDGHKKFGMIEIGPWFKWFSANQHEANRIRFDIGTTEKFSEHLRLYGYLAYGVKDARFKGRLAFKYKINKHESFSIFGSYTNDLDNGRIRFKDDDEASIDNLFSTFIRRKGVTQKFINVESYKLAFSKEWQNNLSAKLSFVNSNYKTFAPLPSSSLFAKNELINSEIGLTLRYAPDEKKIVGRRRSIALKGKLPVIEIGFAKAIPQLFRSESEYIKYTANVTQSIRVPRWGNIDYMAYGGRIDGDRVPFVLLEIHPGNEVFYYNKNSFNLMNRFEFISDFYGGFNIEHNFEKKLLNLAPFLRKTKMRQFWNVKAVWGDLSRR
ncbi:MAG: carboxypeptidase-like regulatory domain-containing protein, partial [Deinococcales bacterium]|nr:carboxypeptidase-like regulatory domain-containing protein [Chitinophagaceae bacterium]